MGYRTTRSEDPSDGGLRGTLFLEDGLRFDGTGFGAPGSAVGEVVFTTGMVGYPEALTDPSYRGQLLCFTYPLLGNYGVPDPEATDRWGLSAYLENPRVQVRGLVVRGLTRPNHRSSSRSLPRWLNEEGVPGIAGVDTRRLTEHLRSTGVLRGVLDVRSPDARPSDEELSHRIRSAPEYAREALVADVAPRAPTVLSTGGGPLVAVLDCGIKASILRALLTRGLDVLRLPFDHDVPETWDGRPVAGLVIGNGPGDPAMLAPTIEAVGAAVDRKLPTLGICLGHQLLALSRGGETYKLKFGHRGQNKTVQFPGGRALIVSENHGYAVDTGSLAGTGLTPWATNPDDSTLEGLRDRRGGVLALQGHPEGHPGPQEAGFVFDLFANKVRRSSA